MCLFVVIVQRFVNFVKGALQILFIIIVIIVDWVVFVLVQVCKLEADIEPLQEQNRSLTAERDALSTDKISLTIEVTRWKQRTNHLIEQCNRADPEEQKRLCNFISFKS